MKFLVVVSCLLAVASAGLLGPVGYGRSRIAVVDQNGYKIDNADYGVAVGGPIASYAAPLASYAAPITTYAAAPITTYAAAPVATIAAAAPVVYSGPQHLPVIGPNGVPLDEPAVVAARANHAAAHIEAKVRNADVAVVAPVAAPVAGPVVAYSGPQHIPTIGPNGVPVDEPAVVAARASHAAAHLEAKSRNGDVGVVTQVAGPVVAYSGPQHIPTIGPNGVPVDEPAVVAARASHAAAHLEAKVRNADVAVVSSVAAPVVAARVATLAAPYTSYAATYSAPISSYATTYAAPISTYAAPISGYAASISSYAAPITSYAAPYAYTGYYGAQHIPVIGPNGVPLDEPAVAAGKAANAAAHLEAKVRNGDLVLY